MKEYSNLQYALAYIKRGFKVFPLKPKSKIPATKNGFKDASDDEQQIWTWWMKNPNYNIAIATGSVSGNIFVIDFDIDEDKGIEGYENFKEYCRNNKVEFPDTVTAITGRGGYHWLYRAPENIKITNRTGIIEGVDIRGEGGYIVVPPSIHPNGKPYEWEQDFNDISIADADNVVLGFLNQKDERQSESFSLPDIVPKGKRNTTFFKMACSMQAKGYSDSVIITAVLEEAKLRSNPPLNDDDIEELKKTINSALTKEKGMLVKGPPKGTQFISLDYYEDKQGNRHVKQTIDNVCIVLNEDEQLAGKIKYNTLSYAPFVYGALPWDDTDTYREWNNIDDANLLNYMEKNYGIKSDTKVMNGLDIIAHENHFSPVVEWLNQLKWDGKEHIRYLLPKYLGVNDDKYQHEVMLVFMKGAIARAFKPGCKFDYVPILVGEQGSYKSTFLRVLACNDDWFSDNFNTIEGDKAAEKLRGMWIVEYGELLALKRAKEVESAKAFITSVSDTYREPYKRRTEQRPRACVFAGTTNNQSFLSDKTGNRRFLPIEVDKEKITESLFDNPDAVMEDFKQAWAEALILYNKDNSLVLSKIGQTTASEMQKQYQEEDVRVGIIQDYLDGLPSVVQYVCVLQIWEDGLKGKRETIQFKDSRAIGEIMNNMITGWKKTSAKRFSQYGIQKSWERTNEFMPDFSEIVDGEVPF